MTYVRIDRYSVAPARRKAFVKAELRWAREQLARKGCIRFDVFEDMDDAGAVLTCQAYESRALYRRLYVTGPTPALTLFATNWYPSDRQMKVGVDELPGKLSGRPKYLHFGIWQIKPAHRQAFLAAMKGDARDSVRLEPGCYRFDMLEDTRRRNCFYLYQIYESARWHDVDHCAMKHVTGLLGRSEWPTWPVRNPRFPMGMITGTGLSYLVRGRLAR